MDILMDVGGTKTRIAATRDREQFGEPVVFETPAAYEEGLEKIITAARSAAAGEPIKTLVAGLPGVISPDHGQLLVAPNLSGWIGKPLGAELGAALDARVYLENDAVQVGLGEAVYGAGKGANIVVYITVSTGVGGVRIVQGSVDMPDTSAEMGHQYVRIGDSLQEWSDVISGTAVHKRFGMHPKELGKDHPVWEELARETAVGVHNAVLYWTPDRVVLGGSMFNDIGIPVERVAFHLHEMMHAFPTVPEVVHSALGDFGGLWGGLVRLRQIS